MLLDFLFRNASVADAEEEVQHQVLTPQSDYVSV